MPLTGTDIDNNDKDEFVISDRTQNNNSLEVDSLGRIPAKSFMMHAAQKLKTYLVSVAVNLPTAGTETRILLLRNPAGSGKTLRLIRINGLVTNTVSTVSLLRAYFAPTITAVGTAATIASTAPGGGAAATAMLAYTGPTASAVGTRFGLGVLVSGTAGGRAVLLDYEGMITLAAGQDILITGTPDGTNRASEITALWSEE